MLCKRQSQKKDQLNWLRAFRLGRKKGKKAVQRNAEKEEKMEVQQAIALVDEVVEAERAEKRLGKKKENEGPETSSQRENASKNF